MLRFRIATCSLITATIVAPVLLHGQTGQTASNSVTVTASQSAISPPDEAIFLVTVNAPFSANLATVVAQLSSLVVPAVGGGTTAPPTAVNLVNVSGGPVAGPNPFFAAATPSLAWTFALTTLFTSQKAMVASLASLQSGIGQNGAGWSLAFSLSGTSAYAPSTCDYSSLMTSARAQAQALATAANQPIGAVTGLTSTTWSDPLLGPQPCTMGVQFALGSGSQATATNSITIHSTQGYGLQANQARVVIGITSGVNTALDDVTSALDGAGITGAALSGVNTVSGFTFAGNQPQPQPQIEWTFTLEVSLSNPGAVLAQLTKAQQTFQTQNSGLSLNFAVEGVSSSGTFSCTSPQNLAVAALTQAQNQAQEIAAAAGVHVGPVLSLNFVTAGPSAASPNLNAVPAPLPASGLSWASTTTTVATTIFGGSLFPQTAVCEMTAQFQLQ